MREMIEENGCMKDGWVRKVSDKREIISQSSLIQEEDEESGPR